MGLVLPLHFAHVIHSFKVAGDPEPMAITYGVKVTDPPGSTDVNGLASGLHAIWNTWMVPLQNPLVTLQQTEVQWQATAPPDPPVVGVDATPHVGTNTANPLIPQNTALLVHKRTALGGRRGRGRMYLPGVTEGQVDNVGNVDSGAITAFNTALAGVLASIVSDADFDFMALLHQTSTHSATPDPTAVSSLTVDPVVATQRRRLRR